MRGGAGRRGRCYGMYPIDPRLSRVAQRSVPRAFAGVMWGMRVGAATQKHRATLLRRAARARRAMGETSYTRGAGGARASVGSAEARVRPSKCPSSALAARARATGNIGFIVRKGRPGKKIADSTTRNLSRKGVLGWELRRGAIGQRGKARLGAAVIKGRGDSEWAARVVLEVGRRSSSLLPDDSGADEATLAA